MEKMNIENNKEKTSGNNNKEKINAKNNKKNTHPKKKNPLKCATNNKIMTAKMCMQRR
jgi:hypothetical protein